MEISVTYGGCYGNVTFIAQQEGTDHLNFNISGNLPPIIPSQPSGSSNGYVNTSYNYSTSTTDPDGDNIYIWFDWDDSTNSGWVGPYSSGTTVSSSHSWDNAGTYQIRAKAKDSYDAEIGAGWSNPLNVTIIAPNSPPYTPSNPDPYDGETDVDVDHDLSWDGGDPDSGDTVTYDIYFDDTSPPSYYATVGPYSAGQTTITYEPGTLDPNTDYYWKIVAEDDSGETSTSPEWSFTTENNPPYTPSNPNPSNGATGVDINADLSWTGGDPDPGDTVVYDVYFGTSSSPPMVSSNQSGTSYEPGTMSYNTQYYWKIVSWDNHGANAQGPLWSFTTGSEPNNPPYGPSNPDPEDGATNVPFENVILSWTGGDPDSGDTVVYDVYFEANNPNPTTLVSDDQSETTFDAGDLMPDTQYYWKIVAKDNHGATTHGPVWDFVTAEGVPDLDCDGSLVWSDIPPGETVTGNFTVENIGDSYSKLDWEVSEWPDWGSWTFTPSNGIDLTPEEGAVTVEVSVVAPNQQNQQFSGDIKLVNVEDSSDFCIISVSLQTPVNQQLNQYCATVNENLIINSHSVWIINN